MFRFVSLVGIVLSTSAGEGQRMAMWLGPRFSVTKPRARHAGWASAAPYTARRSPAHSRGPRTTWATGPLPPPPLPPAPASASAPSSPMGALAAAWEEVEEEEEGGGGGGDEGRAWTQASNCAMARANASRSAGRSNFGAGTPCAVRARFAAGAAAGSFSAVAAVPPSPPPLPPPLPQLLLPEGSRAASLAS